MSTTGKLGHFEYIVGEMEVCVKWRKDIGSTVHEKACPSGRYTKHVRLGNIAFYAF